MMMNMKKTKKIKEEEFLEILVEKIEKKLLLCHKHNQ